MQRAALLRRIVRGVFEEQRIVEPQARGENQRDEMKQRQRGACGLQYSDDDQDRQRHRRNHAGHTPHIAQGD